ncbi:MAG: ferritin [Paludibacteraceae bacterium]|nr:ferritin [Paludibacteraceae bacterium]
MTNSLYTAMNSQINAELWSAYLYLSMSLNAEKLGYSGIANWFYHQHQEEQSHARLFQEFMQERDVPITLLPIEAVPTSWNTIEEMFEKTLEHEQQVTLRINHLMAIAKEQKDYMAEERLWWFIREQLEEEATARGILMDLRLIDGDRVGLYHLNERLGKRVAS